MSGRLSILKDTGEELLIEKQLEVKESLGQISVRRWQKSQVKLAAQFKPIFFVAYFIKPLGKNANTQPWGLG